MSDDVGRKELPRLSLAERNRRWSLVRSAMREEGIDCMLVHGDSGRWDQKFTNMRYLSQIGGNGEDGWLVFPVEGEPVAYVFSGGSMLEVWRDMQDWVSDVRHAPGRRWSTFLVAALRERGLTKGRIGVVGLATRQEPEGSVPYTTMLAVTAELPQAVFTDATEILERLQRVRSAEEIAFIEEATRIGDRAVEVMRGACRPGVDEYQAYARTFEALLAAGSEQPVTFFWDSGRDVNHAQRYPARRRLQEGDIVVTEISPRYFGYWSHFQAMVGLGEPASLYGELFDVVYASYENALAELRPGITLRDLCAAFEGPIRERGAYSLHPYAHGTGGRGSDFPVLMPPRRVAEFSPERRRAFERLMDSEVQEGMVFAFEPHATRDGVHGVHVGDPVVVTTTGCRRLSVVDLAEWTVRS